MKKKNKSWSSWVSTTATAMIADEVARRSPHGTLARRHAGKIAARYARRSRYLDRKHRAGNLLLFGGGILLVSLTVWITLIAR